VSRIDAKDIDPVFDKLGKDLFVFACGSYRGDDLGAGFPECVSGHRSDASCCIQ
jgi:hypothetical protein